MRDVLYKKDMVLAIIFLFVGAGFLPNINGSNTEVKQDSINLKDNMMYEDSDILDKYTMKQNIIGKALLKIHKCHLILGF